MTDEKQESVGDVLAEMRGDTSSYPDRTYWADRIEAALKRRDEAMLGFARQLIIDTEAGAEYDRRWVATRFRAIVEGK